VSRNSNQIRNACRQTCSSVMTSGSRGQQIGSRSLGSQRCWGNSDSSADDAQTLMNALQVVLAENRKLKSRIKILEAGQQRSELKKSSPSRVASGKKSYAEALSSQPSSSQADQFKMMVKKQRKLKKPTVCWFFTNNICKFENRCRNIHEEITKVENSSIRKVGSNETEVGEKHRNIILQEINSLKAEISSIRKDLSSSVDEYSDLRTKVEDPEISKSITNREHRRKSSRSEAAAPKSIDLQDVELQEIKEQTQRDEIGMALREVIINGWPSYKNLKDILKPFWKSRDELQMIDGVIYGNQKIFIPKILRGKITKRSRAVEY